MSFQFCWLQKNNKCICRKTVAKIKIIPNATANCKCLSLWASNANDNCHKYYQKNRNFNNLLRFSILDFMFAFFGQKVTKILQHFQLKLAFEGYLKWLLVLEHDKRLRISRVLHKNHLNKRKTVFFLQIYLWVY